MSSDMFRIFRALCVLATLVMMSQHAASQSLGLDVLNLDASAFRTITARVRASADGSPIRNLGAKNFGVRENGITMSSLITFCEDSASAQPVSVLLVIDRSGSMSAALGAAKAAAVNFSSRLSVDDEMALLSFTNTSSYDQPWTKDRALMVTRINALQVPTFGGGTALWDATVNGSAVLQDRTLRKVMIILSDGDDRDSQHTFAEARQAVVAGGILVYTIGLGTGINVTALTDLAQSTGGKFFYAPSSADLERIYQEISSSISTSGVCTLTWQSPIDCLDGSLVNVDIDLEAYGKTHTTRVTYQRPLDSTTLSFVGLAMKRDHVVDAGKTVDVPLLLDRVTANRAPDRFTFTLTYDRSLLELVKADTTSLSAGYSVALLPSPSGSTISMTGTRAISSTGPLLTLTFRAADSFDSRTVGVGVSLPDVGRTCTWPSAEAGMVTISGRCERAMVRTGAQAAPLLTLLPPTPNPFNPTAHVVYELTRDATVTMTMHDVAGRLIRTLVSGRVKAGRHDTVIDGTELATGPYYISLRGEGEVRTRRVMLMK